MKTSDPSIELEVVGATKRYLDGFRVAQTIIAIGNAIKIVGAGSLLGQNFDLRYPQAGEARARAKRMA